MIIGAIIITYNPNVELVSNFLLSIQKYVDHIFVVDNSSVDFNLANALGNEKKTIILNGENLGIAEAQNIGIKCALEYGIEKLFIFDQDTKIDEHFVDRMVDALDAMRDKKIACIGPCYDIEIKDNFSSAIEKEFIIASGSLYNIDIFSKVGFFKSEWFIDLIDVEWCYRARKLGYKSYMIPGIKMEHNIDDNGYPSFLGRPVRIGSPVRQYYLIRNWVFSLKSDSFDTYFKLNTIYNLLSKSILFSLCSPRIKRFQYIRRGFFDGLKGCTGRFKE